MSRCQSTPCPSLADGRHIYWSGKDHQNGRPGCYKSHTQGPCPTGMHFVIDDIIIGSFRCVPTDQELKEHSTNNRASVYNSLMDDWSLFYDESPVDPEKNSIYTSDSADRSRRPKRSTSTDMAH